VQATRELVVLPTPYIAIYRVYADRILILNIKHGRNGGLERPLQPQASFKVRSASN
jgi:hypothetical protein